MIISASRRTDIPAFYSSWFINRLREGFVYVKNPMNSRQISKVSLNHEVVDCIVFWTKNAVPLMDKLDIIDSMGYPYYFLWTITPYGKDIESNVPDKAKMIESFKELSNRIGSRRVIWRYDPIIINRRFTIEYHSENFSAMCRLLSRHTNKCIFSYVDLYTKTSKHAKNILEQEINTQNMLKMAKCFSEIATANHISLETCSEEIELEQFGIGHSACINKETVEDVIGSSIWVKKASQRPFCQCIESVDIGAYDCCLHGCIYCYANSSAKALCVNEKKHNAKFPLLIGGINANDNIVEKVCKTLKNTQIELLK
ncbi:MAG: hypothetical protein H6Q72_348 [Firmicutes bacterium]|nr:hypothetical protein [Bacillota bacterium]